MAGLIIIDWLSSKCHGHQFKQDLLGLPTPIAISELLCLCGAIHVLQLVIILVVNPVFNCSCIGWTDIAFEANGSLNGARGGRSENAKHGESSESHVTR